MVWRREAETNKRREEERKRKETLDALARDGKRRMEYLDSCSLDALESAIKRKKEKAEKQEKERIERENKIEKAVSGEPEKTESLDNSTVTHLDAPTTAEATPIPKE